MRRTPRERLSVLLLVLLLFTPSAIAAWSAKGTTEPDTAYDASPAFARHEPDVSPSADVRLVYFNGFASTGGALVTSANPNVAALGSAIAPAPFLPLALLGVWKDCNADGFVGSADTGAVEYPSALLADTTICPPMTPPPEAPWIAHNDGSWVVELAPIGYDDITTPDDEDPLNVNDTGARVWADWGVPDAAPTGICATIPAPRGTFRSTGGLVAYADCLLGGRLGPVPVDEPNPWGSEADDAMVTAFSCEGEGTPLVVQDPTGGDLDALADEDGTILSFTLRDAAPAADETGSPAGTVNETEAAAQDCDRSDADETVDLDGHRTGSDGDLPYALEGPVASTAAGARRARTDHVLAYEEGSRASVTSLALGTRARDDAGTGAVAITGYWVGTGSGTLARNAYVSRQALGVEPVTHVTYYAWVSESVLLRFALQAPSTGVAHYGLSGCAAQTFECDAAKWWLDESGDDIAPRDARLGVDPDDPTVPSREEANVIGVRIGQPFRFRDVDCYDASADGLREAGAHWGALTQSACA